MNLCARRGWLARSALLASQPLRRLFAGQLTGCAGRPFASPIHNPASLGRNALIMAPPAGLVAQRRPPNQSELKTGLNAGHGGSGMRRRGTKSAVLGLALCSMGAFDPASAQADQMVAQYYPPPAYYRPPPPGYYAPPPPCAAVSPGPVRGAGRGAAGGALVGAISGNAGRGAAIGATVGGVAGAARHGTARAYGACY
jgi:Glycine-zipper domain